MVLFYETSMFDGIQCEIGADAGPRHGTACFAASLLRSDGLEVEMMPIGAWGMRLTTLRYLCLCSVQPVDEQSSCVFFHGKSI